MLVESVGGVGDCVYQAVVQDLWRRCIRQRFVIKLICRGCSATGFGQRSVVNAWADQAKSPSSAHAIVTLARFAMFSRVQP